MPGRWQSIVAILIILTLLVSLILVAGCGEKKREEIPTPTDSTLRGVPIVFHGTFSPTIDAPAGQQAAVECTSVA